jgi:hypothetical protein
MKGKKHHEDGHMAHHEMYGHHPHKARHHRKAGGRIGGPKEGDIDKDEAPTDVYAGGSSPTVKEAKKKRGGSVGHHMKHVDMHGHHAKHRLDRPARKHGGKVGGGAEMHPFSAASKVKTPAGRDVDALDD